MQEQLIEAELKLVRERGRTRGEAERQLAAAEQRSAALTKRAGAVVVEEAASVREEFGIPEDFTLVGTVLW